MRIVHFWCGELSSSRVSSWYVVRVDSVIHSRERNAYAEELSKAESRSIRRLGIIVYVPKTAYPEEGGFKSIAQAVLVLRNQYRENSSIVITSILVLLGRRYDSATESRFEKSIALTSQTIFDQSVNNIVP